MPIYAPITSADSWRQFLADPDKQWKKGFSAKTLAYCWQEAEDRFPSCVAAAFRNSGLPELQQVELLLAIPEHKVELPGGKRASQTDLFVVAKNANGLLSIAVEGKVDEPFGPLVTEWLATRTEGKEQRLNFLCKQLGITPGDVSECRYQLLHRTVSAVIEARRFGAAAAMMLVHAFSDRPESFDDYARFVPVLGGTPKRGSCCRAKVLGEGSDGEISLYFGWVDGDRKYLRY